jgi:hypothetical protein
MSISFFEKDKLLLSPALKAKFVQVEEEEFKKRKELENKQ